MGYLTGTIILLLCACTTSLSQCPSLKVIGPGGVVNPGDKMTFALELASDGELTANSINWEVNQGKIVSGQGTLSIEVVSEIGGITITATAKVSGFPATCINSASETGPVAQLLEGHPVDEFGTLPNDDQRGRMDLFFAELANNPSNIGFIQLFDKDSRALQKRMRFVLEHVRFRRFDKSTLSFSLSVQRDQKTILWRVPPGAKLPCPNCKRIFGRDLK